MTTVRAARREALEDRSPLFPARQERQRVDDALTRDLAAADEHLRSGPVVPTFDRERFRRELEAVDFVTARPLDEILAWVIDAMERGLVHVTHPRYFGLFNPAPTFPAQCADRVSAVFNPQLATSTTSPAAVEIERHVIRAVARRAGLSGEAGGHFTTGGAEANYTALICALTEANPRFGAEGARTFAGPPALYTSRESHLAWLKIAHQAGIGRDAVRFVATDGAGRMEAGALDRMIESDLAEGRVPVLVAATAGTTNAGMIDPLAACAAAARRRGLWYHVDAAWGGAVIASERYRHLLAGLKSADSITIDAHKWFASTMGCGMFLTAKPSVPSAAFHVATSFMPSRIADLDPYITSVQWSRRFLGLRLFLSLAAAGWRGYGAHVERAIDLCGFAKEKLVARGWVVANDSSLAVLCVEPPPGLGPARAVANRIVASGRAWVAAATFEGRDVVRICMTHGETGPDDLEELVDALHSPD